MGIQIMRIKGRYARHMMTKFNNVSKESESQTPLSGLMS